MEKENKGTNSRHRIKTPQEIVEWTRCSKSMDSNPAELSPLFNFTFDDTMQKRLADFKESQKPAIKKALEKLGVDIPMDVAIDNALVILDACAAQDKCQTCHKEHNKVITCHVPHIIYDSELQDVRVQFSSCPYLRQEKERRLYESRLEEMLISPKFRNRTFENFIPSAQSQKIVDYCRAWVANFTPGCKGLYLFGTYGSGKTHLAVASLLSLRSVHGICGVFMVVPAFLDELKAQFRNGEEQERRFKVYRDAPVLVIDDLGEGRKEADGSLSEWAREKMFTLINYRYEHSLTTIITTRYTPRDMVRVLGTAVVSRLAEMCTFLHNKDDDHRFNDFTIIE